MNAKTLESTALHLPAQERAALAHKLLLSLEDQSESDIRLAWEAEAQRRAQQIRTGETTTLPAQDVRIAAQSLLK
jgi:putative addiction module component (TIGR02574 family)